MKSTAIPVCLCCVFLGATSLLPARGKQACEGRRLRPTDPPRGSSMSEQTGKAKGMFVNA
jgi:hypothetical protein